MLIKRKFKIKTTPYLTILLSFLGVIFVGAFLLSLPFSTKDNNGLSIMDALFTAVSSTCVTGLMTISNLGSTMSIFGKIVIALLIEIGGLSFLTIAIFVFVLMGTKVGFTNRLLLKEALNQNTTIGVVGLVKRIVLMSLSIQFIGGIINTMILYFNGYFSFFKSLGVGFFHAISSFNNAGIDIFETSTNMIIYEKSILLNINTMLLIIVGGIGFIVIYDVFKSKSWRKFSLHTKIVLPLTFILLIIGTILIKLSTWELSWFDALFHSVSTRTAGFAIFDIKQLSNSGKMITVFLMFIGTAPCSTGGGIKITTFFVICLTIIYYARGKSPKAFYRKISDHSIYKAFSLMTIAVLYNALIILLISFLEPQIASGDIIFEVISAFGTTGLSMGVTKSLGIIAKILMCITMFFGRLGPLTIISIWNNNYLREKEDQVSYIEEKLIIG